MSLFLESVLKCYLPPCERFRSLEELPLVKTIVPVLAEPVFSGMKMVMVVLPVPLEGVTVAGMEPVTDADQLPGVSTI